MPLSEEQKGEIALALLKYQLSQEGFVPERITQEMENVAEATGINQEVLAAFWREVTHGIIERNFGELGGLVGGTKGWINSVP